MTRPTPIDNTRTIPCRNDSGEEIPAFALMRPTGWTTRGYQGVLTVEQPNADGQSGLVFNGPTPIPAGSGSNKGFGQALVELPNFALYDTGDGTPANGETWGAKDGEWKLRKGYAGYSVIGGAANGVVLVDRVSTLKSWAAYLEDSPTTTSGTFATVGDWVEDATGTTASGMVSLASGVFTVNEGGMFLVTFNGFMDLDNATPSYDTRGYVQLELDDGGGYDPINGTRREVGLLEIRSGPPTVVAAEPWTVSRPVVIAKDDKLRVTFARDSGSDTIRLAGSGTGPVTPEYACYLSLLRIA